MRHSAGMHYEELKADVLKAYPTFQTVPKEESRLMRVIAVLLGWLGNDTFMATYTTTIGYTMYTPTMWDTFSDEQKCQILLHEQVHMKQAAEYGVLWFSFLYLFVPMPFFRAHWRTKFEQEAYYVSMRSRAALYGISYIESDDYRDNMIQHFIGPDYGWMWTNRKDIEEWYDASVEKIRKELVLS